MSLNSEVDLQKTDLIKFQKSLNTYFLEIFASKNDSSSELNEKQEVLGLGTSYEGLNLFISLKELQSLATKIKYENSVRTKSWVLGFNQEHGIIYTIFNLNKVFSLLLENKTDFEPPRLSLNSNVMYVKNNADENFGFLLDEFKLEDTTKASLVFDHKIDDKDFMSWESVLDVEINSLFSQQNLSELEWNLIQKFSQLALNKEKYMNGVYPSYKSDDKCLLLALMIRRVFVDPNSKRPLFVLNVKNLTKFLVNVSPF